MKQFDRRPTIEQARAEFEAIAQEMNLPIENLEVVKEWIKRGEYYNDKIAEELIPAILSQIVKDKDGHPVAREASKSAISLNQKHSTNAYTYVQQLWMKPIQEAPEQKPQTKGKTVKMSTKKK